MKQVNLYNKQGQLITVINIRGCETPDAIMWGIRFFVFNSKHSRFEEANVSPAIIDSLK